MDFLVEQFGGHCLLRICDDERLPPEGHGHRLRLQRLKQPCALLDPQLGENRHLLLVCSLLDVHGLLGGEQVAQLRPEPALLLLGISATKFLFDEPRLLRGSFEVWLRLERLRRQLHEHLPPCLGAQLSQNRPALVTRTRVEPSYLVGRQQLRERRRGELNVGCCTRTFRGSPMPGELQAGERFQCRLELTVSGIWRGCQLLPNPCLDADPAYLVDVTRARAVGQAVQHVTGLPVVRQLPIERVGRASLHGAGRGEQDCNNQ